MDIMRQTAFFVITPIYRYSFLFNCTTVGQASNSMTDHNPDLGLLDKDKNQQNHCLAAIMLHSCLLAVNSNLYHS